MRNDKIFLKKPVHFETLQAVMSGKTSQRYYVVPGQTEKYPSMTTILSTHNQDGIEEWRKKVGDREANYVIKCAVRRGNRIHTMAEDYLNGADVCEAGYNIFDQASYGQIKRILNTHVDNIRAQEATVYSNKLRVAGRFDLFAEYASVLSLIDFKTSKYNKPEAWMENYFLQTAGYAYCIWEMTGIYIPQIVIISAVDDDNFGHVTIKKTDDYVSKFFDVVKAWHKEND